MTGTTCEVGTWGRYSLASSRVGGRSGLHCRGGPRRPSDPRADTSSPSIVVSTGKHGSPRSFALTQGFALRSSILSPTRSTAPLTGLGAIDGAREGGPSAGRALGVGRGPVGEGGGSTGAAASV